MNIHAKQVRELREYLASLRERGKMSLEDYSPKTLGRAFEVMLQKNFGGKVDRQELGILQRVKKDTGATFEDLWWWGMARAAAERGGQKTGPRMPQE
jgi:hypothetical protein